MLTKNHIGKLFAIVIVHLFTITNSFGQEAKVDFDRSKPKRISLIEFHSRVDRATKLLQTKQLSAIADKDHINIMMCLNTIFMSEKRFNYARYKKLKNVADEKNYLDNINKVYPQWTYSRGMGRYYLKLKMEIYGTPDPYATFVVSK